jgi:hypothetical protein
LRNGIKMANEKEEGEAFINWKFLSFLSNHSHKEEPMTTQPTETLLTGVINPYALAEVKVGHAIQWQDITNPRKVLEQLLGHPYEQLFDPQFHSPLYAGLKYDAELKALVRDATDPMFSAKSMEEALISVLKRTGDFAGVAASHEEPLKLTTRQRFAVMLEKLETKADISISVDVFEKLKQEEFFKRQEEIPLINPKVIKWVQSGGGSGTGFNWIDPGRFFTDATSPLDAIQGALADCYFVAALASVAWARPYTIVQRTRQTDAAGQFATPGAVDLVLFWNGSSWDRVEVNELLPLQPPADNYVYVRSDDPTETWSAVYEKAYVMWRTGDQTNSPDYNPIAFGDTVAAAVALTGLSSTYYATAGTTAFNIWQNVRAHSLSYKTFDPMVAWTYSSGSVAPTPIDYNSAALVANHAYSILGWDYKDGQEYIVLRNPWGYYEATLNVESGSWYAYDGSFWYPVPLSSQGVFALRADTFQQYFAGYGVVSGNDNFPAS